MAQFSKKLPAETRRGLVPFQRFVTTLSFPLFLKVGLNGFLDRHRETLDLKSLSVLAPFIAERLPMLVGSSALTSPWERGLLHNGLMEHQACPGLRP